MISSLLATRESVVQGSKHGAHEIFGYDFMVDTSLNVWLIEVNSSPSMEYSSHITEKLVKEVLWDLADMAGHQDKLRDTNGDFQLGDKVGNFELIYID